MGNRRRSSCGLSPTPLTQNTSCREFYNLQTRSTRRRRSKPRKKKTLKRRMQNRPSISLQRLPRELPLNRSSAMRLWRINPQKELPAPPALAAPVLRLAPHEADDTGRQRVQRVVAALADVSPRVRGGSALAHQHVARRHVLAVHHLRAQPLADAVAPVLGGALGFLRRVPHKGRGER